MKRLLSADLYQVLRGKSLYFLLAGAVLGGVLLPLFFYGTVEFLKFVVDNASDLGIPEMDSLVNSLSILNTTMTGDNLFLMLLPMSEGYGLVITAILCHFHAKQFSNGIIRNKIVIGCPRGKIYLSMLICALLLAVLPALVYALCCALTSSLCFGALTFSAGELVRIVTVSTMAYVAYAGILALVAFATKNTVAAIITGAALPLVMNLVFSVVGTFASGLPESVQPVLAIFPSFQSLLVGAMAQSDAFFTVALVADVMWLVLTTIPGILLFKKADVK